MITFTQYPLAGAVLIVLIVFVVVEVYLAIRRGTR